MKVFLVPPPALALPAVKGGAVETLITHLMEENEIQQKLELVCVSLPDPDAEQAALRYRHTRLYYLPAQPLRQKLWGPVCGQLRRMKRPAPLDCWYNQVLRAVQAEQPDLVVTEGGDLTETQMISQVMGRDRCFAHLHMQLKATPLLERMYGNILAISQFVADSYQPTRPVRIHLVPNCVDLARFSPRPAFVGEQEDLRRRLGFEKEDFVLLFCGRICPEKGIHHLIEALGLLPDPRIKLLVIGSPFFAAEDFSPFFEQLKEKQKALQGRLVFTGFVPNDQLPAYYRMANAACFPAVWDEPAGITAIEAMACGCPVIATQSGGMPEYLEGSDAILLPRDQRIREDGSLEELPGAPALPQSIAQAVEQLRADPRRAADMSAAGCRRAQDFSRQAYYQNFVAALKR